MKSGLTVINYKVFDGERSQGMRSRDKGRENSEYTARRGMSREKGNLERKDEVTHIKLDLSLVDSRA